MTNANLTSPVRALAEEHALILRGLRALEIKLHTLAAGAPPDRVWTEQLLEFLRVFADRCHHGKEEGLLFPVMVGQLDFPAGSGPIAVLSRDHESGRALVGKMSAAAACIQTDPMARRALVDAGQRYIDLLRAHIDREDNKVFPTVEDLLEPEEAARLSTQFAEFDAGAEDGRNAPGRRNY